MTTGPKPRRWPYYPANTWRTNEIAAQYSPRRRILDPLSPCYTAPADTPTECPKCGARVQLRDLFAGRFDGHRCGGKDTSR